jgi:hypothetical protein
MVKKAKSNLSRSMKAKRASVQAALADRAKNTERRVYVMPRELVSRILDYQL